MDQPQISGKIKTLLISIIFGILAVIIVGLFSFFIFGSSSPVGLGWYVFSFAAGLTMIVLPCTLPLAFVIVPLSMGKGPIRGLMIALAFGLGITITLSMYGVVTALVGKAAITGLGASLETIKNYMYLVAGFFAYVFALGELGLVRFRMPTYSGAYPMFIQRQQDIIKALLLGLFLGNIGIGCPHPATPVILTRIAVSGSVFYGWSLFLIHALGRVLPLLFLALLGILGVNALKSLVKHKDKIERATGWGMVFVAAFILVLGLFSHDWWVNSGQHVLFEEIVQEQRFTNLIADNLDVANVHTHGIVQNPRTLFGLPWQLGNWVLVFLWMLPFWWYYAKQKKSLPNMSEEDRKVWTTKLPILFWLYTLLTVSLFIIVVYLIPFRFLVQSGGGMSAMQMHSTMYHEASNVTQGVSVDMNLSPVPVPAGSSTRIDFLVNKKPGNIPLSISLLDINHAKYMHVLGVRDDMNEFFHIHPQASTTRGLMTVDHTFVKPGNYKIWAEITESGVDNIYGQATTTVVGIGESSNKRVSFERLAVVDDQYQVRLITGTVIGRRRTENLNFEIHDKQGREVQIEPYLGADMHLTIIKDDWTRIIHAHPVASASSSTVKLPAMNMSPMMEMPPTMNMPLLSFISPFIPVALADAGHSMTTGIVSHGILFQVVFPTSGLYRAFAQFRPGDTLLPIDEALTTSFWIEVKDKGTLVIPEWPTLPIASLILMVILVIIVRHYIQVPKNFSINNGKLKI